jgi:hypothetical protein
MVMAAKENPYLNCLSEPPAKFEEEEEAAAAEPLYEDYAPVEENPFGGLPETEETSAGTADDEEKQRKKAEQEERRRQREAEREAARKAKDDQRARKRAEDEEKRKRWLENTTWKPLGAFTQKVTKVVEKIIDTGYDGMKE